MRGAAAVSALVCALALRVANAAFGDTKRCANVVLVEECSAVVVSDAASAGDQFDVVTLQDVGELYNPGEGITRENWDAAFRYLYSGRMLGSEVPSDDQGSNEISKWCRLSDSCALSGDDPVTSAPLNPNASLSDPLHFLYQVDVDLLAELPRSFARRQSGATGTYQVLFVAELGARPASTTDGVFFIGATFSFNFLNEELKDVALFVQWTQLHLVIDGGEGLTSVDFDVGEVRAAFADELGGLPGDADLSGVTSVRADLFVELGESESTKYVNLCANLTLRQLGGPNVRVVKSSTVDKRVPPIPGTLYARRVLRDESGLGDASESFNRTFVGAELAAKKTAIKCHGPLAEPGDDGDGISDGGGNPDNGSADETDKGLGAGAIAGIVVGAIMSAGLLLAAAVWLNARRRRKHTGPKPHDEESGNEAGLSIDSDEKAAGTAAMLGDKIARTDESEDIVEKAYRDDDDAGLGAHTPAMETGGALYSTTDSTQEAKTRSLGSDAAFAQIIIPKQRVRQLELIGSGGFASVYRGQYGGEDVAIKVLHRTTQDLVGKEAAMTFYKTQALPSFTSSVPSSAGAVNSEAIPEDVKREIMSLEKCRHPAVAGFYGVCLGVDEHDPVWLVMELAKRGTLQDVLHSTTLQQFPWQERIKIAHHIALGMEYLHTAPRNIAHLDLKPDNIILNEAGMPRVIDFGIAGFYSTEGESSGLRARRRGTLMYMAPELLSIEGNEELREPEKADVYSFGMLCFVLAHQCGGDGAPLGRTVDAEGLESEDAGADGFAAYLSRLDDVLFRLTATARCDPRLYLDMVLAFRAEYGYQMRCAAACPISLREVITRCTRHDPNLRPCFSELIELLSAPH